MAASQLIIENARIITPISDLADTHVLVRKGVIEAISSSRDEIRKASGGNASRVYDATGCLLTPGLIELHSNGGGGVDAYHEDLSSWCEFLSRTGVTALMPTLVTRPLDDMVAAASRIAQWSRQPSTPRLLGVYPEGPFISGRYGQQPADNCLNPREDDYLRLLAALDGTRSIITTAPELPGAFDFIERIVGAGHIAAIGHTGADAATTGRAVDLGARLASHIADAMSFCTPKAPETSEGKLCGVVAPNATEVLLTRDEVYAEVIVDQVGAHVHPVMLEIIRRCKPADRFITISDNMAAAGMPDGRYETVDGRTYVIDRTKDDLIRLEPEGTLAGVVYALKDGIRNLMDQTGTSLCDAVTSVTLNPARLLGLEESIGSIEVGKKADIAVFDADWNVVLTLVEGKISFQSDTFAARE